MISWPNVSKGHYSTGDSFKSFSEWGYFWFFLVVVDFFLIKNLKKKKTFELFCFFVIQEFFILFYFPVNITSGSCLRMRFTCFDPGQTSEQSRTLENHQRDAKKFKFSSNMAPFLFRQTTISFALDVDEKGVTIYIYMYDGIKEKKNLVGICN